MKLSIPDMSLVVLIGASGSGKSTFAHRHFLPTQILSSDFFRGLVSDDETDQSATNDAFETLHYVAGKRLLPVPMRVPEDHGAPEASSDYSANQWKFSDTRIPPSLYTGQLREQIGPRQHTYLLLKDNRVDAEEHVQ